jgi:3'-phosphoadenosine 5'-phosphosulfate sulfotransferase (PAPS reductase)/FAD synthetase
MPEQTTNNGRTIMTVALPIIEKLDARRVENNRKTVAARQRFFESNAIKPTSNYKDLVAQGLLLSLEKYEKIVYSFSGGKDSLAGLLVLLELMKELGVSKDKLELWHQHVDGDPSEKNGLMDWPCTDAYCRAVAEALDVTLRYQWRVGGIEKEMLRENTTVQGVCFENENGDIVYLEPNPPAKKCKCGHVYNNKTDVVCPECNAKRGNVSTRRKFPMVCADLRKRWCSGVAKIDVARRTISNDPRFKQGSFLMLTGERREESNNRAKYDEVVPYNSTKARRVDQWRNVLDWSESQVWDIIRRWMIDPHPAYKLGFGRVSCMKCIYGGEDEWATIREIDPTGFEKIANYEVDFESTIATRKEGKKTVPYSVHEKAEVGKSFVVSAPANTVEQAMGHGYNESNIFVDNWQLPQGAFKRCSGPE